jgi:hypothetical protein
MTLWYLPKVIGLWYLGGVDTPQAPYPCIDRCRPKLSDAYRSSYAEWRCDDSSHMQSRWHISLHSYASNHSNAQWAWSVPSIIVYTLVSYATYLSLIIFKIIPHPMTLLTAFPLQVIILHLTYFCLLTIALLIHCLVVISRALASVLPIA